MRWDDRIGKTESKEEDSGEELKRVEYICRREDVYIEQYKTLHSCLMGDLSFTRRMQLNGVRSNKG